MSKKLQPARGTHDMLPDEARIYEFIVDTAREVSEAYGFRPFSTPIFEFTEVFQRSIGETTDIVSKEMYTFNDKGDKSITLRPEFTAGIVRAFISNGLQQNLPVKLFSSGPVFRYERPQKGRLRQFHQLNFEWLGNGEPHSDVETIIMASQLLNSLGIANYSLDINSLGDKESREKHKKALVKYLKGFEKDLSDDSKKRLKKNPLRILDSKDEGDKKIVKNAPVITEYFNDESKAFFDKVKSGLEAVDLEYNENPNLVRGLDYYNHTVFEFIGNDGELGAQNALIAGGRYNGLVEQMGGQDTPAVGFAAGIERLMLSANIQVESEPFVAVIPETEDESSALNLITILREEGVVADLYVGGSFNKRMKKAGKLEAALIIIVKEDHQMEMKPRTDEGEDLAGYVLEIMEE